jgi:hypothetical protein
MFHLVEEARHRGRGCALSLVYREIEELVVEVQ